MPRTIRTLALAGSTLFATLGSLAGCKRAPEGQSAPAATSSSAAAKAASSVTPAAFCAFLETLIVEKMNRADTKGELALSIKKANAKKMNEGCEKSITATVAKDPAGWERCAACLTSKTSLEALKACDADCKSVGYGGGARPASSASAR